MTILDLKEIFESADVFEKRYLIMPEELSFPAELGDIREPVEVNIRIEKEKDGYDVRLSIFGSVELECSRCLTTFEKDLSQERKKHIEYYPSDEHISLAPEDLEVSFMEEPDIINLEDLVREEIILSIPMKPLCRPDCSGIHHSSLLFGEENETHTDPRFAILKDLLAK